MTATKKDFNIYFMDATQFRKSIIDDMFDSNLVVRQTDINSEDIQYIVGCSVYDILDSYLGSITDDYLSERKLLLLKLQIKEASDNLTILLKPSDLFLVWRDIDKLLDRWEEAAIHYELYEGVVNFKKLRDMV